MAENSLLFIENVLIKSKKLFLTDLTGIITKTI